MYFVRTHRAVKGYCPRQSGKKFVLLKSALKYKDKLTAQFFKEFGYSIIEDNTYFYDTKYYFGILTPDLMFDITISTDKGLMI